MVTFHFITIVQMHKNDQWIDFWYALSITPPIWWANPTPSQAAHFGLGLGDFAQLMFM